MDAFTTYLAGGFSEIEGWPGTKESVLFLRVFREWLEERGDRGGACEIGVHHGRYLIALHNLLSPCSSLGIDVFEDQDRNLDYSGKGAMEVCRQNIRSFASDPESVELMSCDSLTLETQEIGEILRKHGRFGIFSVDGGHSPLHTAVDLETARRLTSENGVIAIDDLFHPDWPGVTEGLYNVLSRRESPFVPLYMTRKKMFLCHVSVQQKFSSFVARKFSEEYGRDVRFVTFSGWRIPSLNLGSEY